jgi:hypothetical protein
MRFVFSLRRPVHQLGKRAGVGVLRRKPEQGSERWGVGGELLAGMQSTTRIAAVRPPPGALM